MEQVTYSFKISDISEYHKQYQESLHDPANFWSNIARQFVWRKQWDEVLQWNFSEPRIEWFNGGLLNITENLLDRHAAIHPDQSALIWEPNDPSETTQVFTYKQLLDRVCVFSQVLRNQGVQKGDRVCLYMGMVPELAIAMLACARIGAIHSVIFGGFSAQSIADRLTDAQARFIITCDGAFRGQKEICLKDLIDDALISCPFVERVIVHTRTKTAVSMLKGRDVWLEEEEEMVIQKGKSYIPAVEMKSEDPLFILYTSGSTGKPKGVVHTCAGYMIWTAYTFMNVFQAEPGETHFCTADLGWITGHSYSLYGPLLCGVTSILFEGIPTWPDAGRFWEICDRNKVNILYTAPTAIRSLMTYGSAPLEGKDLSSLRVLGTVGEPINEEAWNWYNQNIGKGRCPIVDTWWQTETGGIMISNLAGITPAEPTFATWPLPGVFPVLINDLGEEVTTQEARGNLCIRFPWPGMIRTTFGDHQRCKLNYFSQFENMYFTGDGCLRDQRGYYRITGRVDDVLNVSGHRIGTAEVENAINLHQGVAESAVVGYPHDLKGQGIYAFVILTHPVSDEDLTRKDIAHTLQRIIGPIAKPDQIQFVHGLPKTRSGKIMRRILRKIASGDMSDLGDTTTLLDPSVVDEIKQGRLT